MELYFLIDLSSRSKGSETSSSPYLSFEVSNDHVDQDEPVFGVDFVSVGLKFIVIK